MKAMQLKRLGNLQDNKQPLEMSDLPRPIPGAGEVLIKVSACGVCHTELDEIEGRTPPPQLPVIPGHQVVGRVVDTGAPDTDLQPGERVGVGWIYSACGHCEYCRAGKENLWTSFRATGRDANGGYAEYMVVPEAFCYPIPELISDIDAAPMLCAGAIGYRSLNLAAIQDGDTLGLTGFGGSAHLVLKMAKFRYPNSPLYVFTRNIQEQEFARNLGASWAGDIEATPPELIHSIIDTTPAWKPIMKGLENLKPGGRLVINAIRKESTDHDLLLQLDYSKHLWMEKEIRSVANVTRADITEFLELAAKAGIKPDTRTYPLSAANIALAELKHGKVHGSKVLWIDP